MADIVDQHEAARRLGMTVEEVTYRLDYGQMMGVEVDGGWRIDTRDLESFRRGQELGRAIAAAGKAPVDSKSPGEFQEISPDASPGWLRNPEYEIDLVIVPARVEARYSGATVAASDRTLTVMELGHGAVYYMPKDDVDWSLFTANTHSSYCQYKGFARYWTLQVGSSVEENVIWAYDEPHREVDGLKDHVGFYWHRMDAWLEDGAIVESPRDIAGRCDARHSFRALYPELARQWHPEKNPNINPYECAPWFRACVWWQDDTGHEWRQPIRDRVLGHPPLHDSL